MQNKPTSWFVQVVVGAVFLTLGIVAVAVFLDVFSPKPYERPTPAFTGYDPAPMQEAVSPTAVRKALDGICAQGSRYMGQEGFYATEKYLRKRFEDAGLEVWGHDIESVGVRTELAEIEVGGRKQDVKLYPLLPAHFQPMNTPPGGLTGELVLLTEDLIANRKDFSGCIGLLDTDQRAIKDYEYNWTRYARLGITALILADHEGVDGIRWTSARLQMAGITGPISYVRLAASPEIFDLVGRTVTLKVRTAYRPIPTTTLVARLKAGAPANDVVVIPASYDAASPMPDLASGTLQAIPVALQLCLLDGLKQYRRDLRRDVVFVCFGSRTMAQDSQNRLLAAIGRNADRPTRAGELQRELKENASTLQDVEEIVPLFEDEAFFRDPGKTLAKLKGSAGDLFEQQCIYVRNTLVFELSEEMLRKKIVFDKDPTGDLTGPAFRAFVETRRRYDRAFAAAGYNVAKLLREQKSYLAEYSLRRRLKGRFEQLRAYHRRVDRRLRQEIALNRLFAGYRNIVVLSPELVTRDVGAAKESESLSFYIAKYWEEYVGDHGVAIRNHINGAIRRLGLGGKVAVPFVGRTHVTDIATRIRSNVGADPASTISTESGLWVIFGYPAFSLVNTDRAESYADYFAPTELPYMRRTETMKYSLAVVGESILSAAFGNGRFPPTKLRERSIISFHGNVYVANVGQSIIPNYPMRGALVGSKLPGLFPRPYFGNLKIFTDPYGHYSYPYCATTFARSVWEYSPDAVVFGDDGIIQYVKDTGKAAQSIFRSMNLRVEELSEPVSMVLYRASPVTILDMINPQTLKAWAGVEFIRRRGLTAFASTNTFTGGGIVTAFIKPDERFYVTFKAGSAENELVHVTRAFMLGTTMEEALAEKTDPDTVEAGREISGKGYLAADSRMLLDVPREIAKSMAVLNAKRLALQNRRGYQMADERVQEFHKRTIQQLSESRGLPIHQADLRARNAATYAMLNHPVLRENIFEAIIGVLWYLGLLVPFVFFFEKLLFGFADIRRQLTAILITFVAAFALLKLLHPAFSMIRSSVMILLGFVILLISLGITVLFCGKFQENIEDIRKRRGRVTAAEVNKLGVLATAFLLGLNNMHRRRVRTLLTCGTLVLMTFVMICFTSVQSDLVDTQVAVGKAPFSGLLVKNEKFKPVTADEVFALNAKYGHLGRTVSRYMYVGTESTSTRARNNPKVEVAYERPGAAPRGLRLSSIIRFSAFEPLQKNIRLLTARGWFTEAQELAEEGLIPIMLPDAAARKLGITPKMVDGEEPVVVTLNERRVLVHGIFEAASLRELRDQDGRDLLPFDIVALRQINRGDANHVIADDLDPRIDPEKIILGPLGRWDIPVADGTQIIHSAAVVLPDDLGYKKTRALIDQYLEQTGRSTYYGLDGVTFLGRRARARSVQGLVEMLIPLIIAALTVLNTMKGSVYERKDEIFVYNAVGISPRHVFFMFFAEAFVYAVVGSVLGYFLSQGAGRILTWVGMTGGLNMTFTSSATIYASLAIAASVFVSTYFPARTAMRIAAPSEDLGWHLPEAQGDLLSFRVPFTFGARDRIAILAFFNRFLLDHGEGGSGPFFAGPPALGVSDRPDELADGAPVPEMLVTIWLKPFDLSVSQEMRISLATDPETGEYIPTVSLSRLSGTRDNWLRLNKRFVGIIRRRLLHWRAVGDRQRSMMFEEARELMRRNLSAAGA